MAKITADMLKASYWEDMKLPELLQFRRELMTSTEAFRRGAEGIQSVDQYAQRVPELVARTDAISRLTELIEQNTPTWTRPTRQHGAHCPRCWRQIDIADQLPIEWLYLFGVSHTITLDLRCRQCKGIRWRK